MSKKWIVIGCLVFGAAIWGTLNWQPGSQSKYRCLQYNFELTFRTEVPSNRIGYPFTFAESTLDEPACDRVVAQYNQTRKAADAGNRTMVSSDAIDVVAYTPYRLHIKGLLADIFVWIGSIAALIAASLAVTTMLRRRKS